MAMRVWFLVEKCPEITNQICQPTDADFRLRPFGKPSKYMNMCNLPLFSERLVQAMAVVTLSKTSRNALFASMLLKLGVSMGVTYLAISIDTSFLRPCNYTHPAHGTQANLVTAVFLLDSHGI